MLWELPNLTTVCLVVSGVWWFFSRQAASPRSFHAHLGIAALALIIDARRPALRLCESACYAVVNATPLQQFRMVLTLGAVVWLLHRSWQTLWKPVPELVSILGVDIPQAPDVCLAGIGADSATLSWTKPASNRPVQKYLIQVNGVHVGDSPGNETAITVTGLRPNHFYNLRVVAVGPNNFRAGSPIIRLRTFDFPRLESGDDNNRPDKPTSSLPMVEAAPVLESSAAVPRDLSVAAPGQRRNTLNRRHSPSVASSDQPQMRTAPSADSELSLAELNEKFEGIRKEIDDTLALYAKDEADSQHQEEELKRDKDSKRQVLKEREEQTAQLKAMMRITMEQMRAAEKERAKKEQQLKDKETKRAKVRDSTTKFENEIERMKKGRQNFEAHKTELAENRDRDVQKLDEDNAELQVNCIKLEAELKDKGKQLQDIKATRAPLPGADDEKWKEEDIRLRRKWELQRREIHNRLVAETKDGHILSQQIRDLGEQLSAQQQAGHAYYNQPGSSSMDFEPSSMTQPNRPGHSGNSVLQAGLSSPDRTPHAEPSFQGGISFNNAAFLPILFTDLTADDANELHTDIEFKGAGGLLSPSAQTLLPSNIFEESEETETMESRSPFVPEPTTEEGPQSPASSNMSFTVFSSPHGSAQNLPFPQYSDNGEGSSFNVHPSPPVAPAAGHKIASFLSTFQRGRGTKTSDTAGPPIGSLKPAQSQSFPSVTDENEALANRRRINISSWVGRGSMAPVITSSGASIASPRPLSALRLNPHKGSPAMGVSDREGEHSRPASIASTDLPRPSTDSGSIWGTPGDPLVLQKNRLWSPGDGRWPSRNGSRRPSLQGSNALTTSLASADDEILDEDDLLNPETLPSQVGVIGSRPPGSSKSMNQRLNPAAPTFMAHIFRKDRDRSKDKGKGIEVTTPSGELAPSLDDSPPGSRASRDTYSVHTQTSVSESHESLQLDFAPSNTASDLNPTSASNAKEPEKAVRKLFRKGSSSKFSLSSRLGKESGLFKKGSGSASNSDRNASADHRSSIGDTDDLGDDIAVLGRSYDSVASSTSLGPSKSKENRESGRKGTWRFSMSSIKKKSKDTPVKDKGGLETDHTADED
ncbi:fibronectin type III domain-containing protein [Hirsutella rhossiliensis]|uniref:Fibronectin type III domain-containing protein n=1 Tax=Hirsutella rhossiliensis TaxID=111463 RepID=A0A9P8N0E2_9HYPO|nr:fibronectin type III domain-containing protein [Hirsutella rhossiliensis]KAH0962457.1 fibronectin type III domain-containing protein [Hirsutella rhossiliensis]